MGNTKLDECFTSPRALSWPESSVPPSGKKLVFCFVINGRLKQRKAITRGDKHRYITMYNCYMYIIRSALQALC